MPKRKFIDKKKAVTFQLVHRSQQDPLITDETAPQHVLVETKKPIEKNAIKDDVVDIDKRKVEQKKYGIFFDDEYDYLQHLHEPFKELENHWEYIEPPNLKHNDSVKQPTIQLPSSVFASEYEEDEGLLRKSLPLVGPQPTWDPDIVATLDDDFDFNDPKNEIEDNFMELAMIGDPENDDDDDVEEIKNKNSEGKNKQYDDSNTEDHDIDDDDVDSHDDNYNFNDAFNDDKDERQSHFTEYSLTSAIGERRNQLGLLDECFEKFYNEYNETEIGPLDFDEIPGLLDTDEVLKLQYLTEFKRNDEIEKYNKEWDRERIQKMQEESNSDDELVELEIDDESKKWDCQSILSTYSNLYNHPKLIDEPNKQQQKQPSKIIINPKTGVPINVFHNENTNKLTTKSLTKFNNDIDNAPKTNGPKSVCDESVLSTLSVLSIRPKDETPEEKHERKRLLREYRMERRIERKLNTLAFREEQKRQNKIAINVRKNQGNTIV